jgi:hypothetical protein
MSMNKGPQCGKFITVYPGPILHSFTALIGELDTVLTGMKAKKGPQTMARSVGHTMPEHKIGLSGLLYYVVVPDYAD